jgi:hypothetical protein
MNQFSPMSEDKTPQPHQRFFGAAAAHPATPAPAEEPAPLPDDFKVNPIPEDDGQKEAPVEEPAPAGSFNSEPEEKPARSERDENYYNITHDHLIRVRKERNAIILKIDKLEDQRIEKGSEDYDDAAREIGKLQSELWHKNNLIEALVKVLVSLG